jgi:tetratricopeptide (TPR) repeat protein
MHRAQYLCEMGELDRALADCCKCIELDPRCAQTYALRSNILRGYMAQQDLERGDMSEQDEEEQGKRQHMLIEAAKDSLAGKQISWHLGVDGPLLFGYLSQHLSSAVAPTWRWRALPKKLLARLAGTKIPFVACLVPLIRSLCYRAESKCVFTNRTKSGQSLEQYSGEQFLPKSWLLKSFFNGYDLLSSSFGIDSSSPATNVMDMIAHMEKFPLEKLVAGCVDDMADVPRSGLTPELDPNREMNDIDDDDDGTSAVASGLAADALSIPNHLKDVSTTASNYSIHSLDNEAYILLKQVTRLFDDEADDDVGKGKEILDQFAKLLGETDNEEGSDGEEAETLFVDTSVCASSIEDLLQFSCEANDNDPESNCNLLALGWLDEFVSPDDAAYVHPVVGSTGIGIKEGQFVDQEEEKDRDSRLALEAALHQKALDTQHLIDRTNEYLERGITHVARKSQASSCSCTSTTASGKEIDLERVSSATSSCPPSIAFQRALQALRTSLGEFLTGVVFDASGCVRSVQEVAPLPAVPSSSKSDKSKTDDEEEEDGVWEDCDEDDEENDAEGDDENEEDGNEDGKEDTEKVKFLAAAAASAHSRSTSFALSARLLSVCSAVAYLAGDSIGAVRCLRNAVASCENAMKLAEFKAKSSEQDSSVVAPNSFEEADYTNASNKFHVDALIKLASLLTDMDELKEVRFFECWCAEVVDAFVVCLFACLQSKSLFSQAELLSPQNSYIFLHRAELEIHGNNFSEAISVLRKAKRLAIYRASGYGNSSPSKGANSDTSGRAKRAHEHLQASIYSLLGVAMFRQIPTRPEVRFDGKLACYCSKFHLLVQLALNELREGVESLPHNIYLQMCLGEVLAQVGDAVGALKCFEKASKLDDLHPLPYVNASRTYQQLNQQSQAKRHITTAIGLDPALAMTRVDLSQQYLHAGQSALALQTLRDALFLARHVSEIHDVLTAQSVANMQLQLEKEGLYSPLIMQN